MPELPPCPHCSSPYGYPDGAFIVCPECAHEYNPDMPITGEREYKDMNGNPLAEGDYVTVCKDLKVKGTSKTVKVGTKVKIMRLMDEDHDID